MRETVIIISIGLLLVLGGSWLVNRLSNNLAKIDFTTSSLIIGYTSAIQNFYDAFGYLPGDIADPNVIIEACKNQNCISGNGNFIIDENEVEGYWQNLKILRYSNGQPNKRALLGGSFYPYYYAGDNPLPFSPDNKLHSAAHFLVITGNGQLNADAAYLKTLYAFRIDAVLDDGKPTSGSVLGAGNPECFKVENDEYVYDLNDTDSKCVFLYYRMFNAATQAELAAKRGQNGRAD